jgi:hypothetical protein
MDPEKDSKYYKWSNDKLWMEYVRVTINYYSDLEEQLLVEKTIASPKATSQAHN